MRLAPLLLVLALLPAAAQSVRKMPPPGVVLSAETGTTWSPGQRAWPGT